MEIALNSAIASSTHHPITIISGETFPKLLDHNDNICKEKYNVPNNNIIGVGHSILNLFGTPTQRCKEEVNALASLTLKNALNVNSGGDKTNESDAQKLLMVNLKDNEKLSQCNSSNRTQQHQHSKSSELLAALKVKTKTSTTSKQATNKSNKILNVSSTSTVSSSSSSSSSTVLPASSSSSSASSSSSSTVLPASLSSSSCSSLSLLSASASTSLPTSPSTSSSTSSTATLTTTTSSPNSTFTTTESGNSSIKNGSQIPSDILDDLASRFIINVPDMELNNMIRICFQIELAHWFYLDFFCASAAADQQKIMAEVNKKRKLPSCGIKQFALQLFQHIPFLREQLSSIDKILDDWKNYKLAVPTFGAILISEDLNFCLLVQSYFAKCSWGFPKGKVNENEDPVHCATREVYEETGYDITHLIVPNDYIEAVINYQYTRLYIVRDVSLKTQFSPRTRNEIKCCDWFPIDSLPINKNDAISKAKLGLNANSFFMIMPFIKRLKRWVHDKRAGIDTRRKYSDGILSNTPTTLMATAAVAAAAAVGGSSVTQNSNNNQKQNNIHNINSGKKIKQHTNNKSDDKLNALIDGTGNTTVNGINSVESVTSSATTNNKSDNSKRSKRQRHKSMGDLDGIKLNNLNSNNCNSNSNASKNSSNIMTTASNAVVESTTAPSTESVGESGNCKTVASQKRNGSAVKLVAAGNSSNNGHNSSQIPAGCTSSKRQLFHSQSENGSIQNGEKIVNSFDLIRKEKQHQLKAAAAQADKGTKAQKQQLQSNVASNSGRVRAKSQGDKMCVQQQEQNKSKTNNTNSSTNNNGGNLKHVQKQTSTIIVNSNTTNNKDNISNNYNKNMINNKNTATNTARVASNQSPSGYELLAFAAEAGRSLSSVKNSTQKQRPASVSLHFETIPIPAAGQIIQQKLQRMASGTNLRILKRSTAFQQSQQKQQQQVQVQPETRSIQQLQQKSLFLQSQLQNEPALHHQQTELKFKPSFNSWTNFSFTKNFIANVFC